MGRNFNCDQQEKRNKPNLSEIEHCIKIEIDKAPLEIVCISELKLGALEQLISLVSLYSF